MKLELLKMPVNAEKFQRLLKQYRVKRIALFGSYAKATQNEQSDVDFLIEFRKGADLFDQAGLKIELEELLKKKVDVVTPNALNKYIKDRILDEAVYL